MKKNANLFAHTLANNLQEAAQVFYQKGDNKTGLVYKEDADFVENTDWDSFEFNEKNLEMLCKTIHLKQVLNTVIAYAEKYKGLQLDHQKFIMMQISVATEKSATGKR